MKREDKEAVLREQKRVKEAEERLKITTSVEECRVADLGEQVEITLLFHLLYCFPCSCSVLSHRRKNTQY